MYHKLIASVAINPLERLIDAAVEVNSQISSILIQGGILSDKPQIFSYELIPDQVETTTGIIMRSIGFTAVCMNLVNDPTGTLEQELNDTLQAHQHVRELKSIIGGLYQIAVEDNGNPYSSKEYKSIPVFDKIMGNLLSTHFWRTGQTYNMSIKRHLKLLNSQTLMLSLIHSSFKGRKNVIETYKDLFLATMIKGTSGPFDKILGQISRLLTFYKEITDDCDRAIMRLEVLRRRVL